MAGRRDPLGGEQLQRVLPGVDAFEGPTGELDGLPQPPEVPRWLDRLSDWVARQVTKPTPRGLRWLDRLEDRCPVWALPWLVSGGMGGLTVLIYVVAPRLREWLR